MGPRLSVPSHTGTLGEIPKLQFLMSFLSDGGRGGYSPSNVRSSARRKNAAGRRTCRLRLPSFTTRKTSIRVSFDRSTLDRIDGSSKLTQHVHARACASRARPSQPGNRRAGRNTSAFCMHACQYVRVSGLAGRACFIVYSIHLEKNNLSLL